MSREHLRGRAKRGDFAWARRVSPRSGGPTSPCSAGELDTGDQLPGNGVRRAHSSIRGSVTFSRMHSRRPRWTVLVLAIAMSTSLVAVPSVAQPLAQAPARASVQTAAASIVTLKQVERAGDPCRDLLWIGVRGSGENRIPEEFYMGVQVSEALKRFMLRLRQVVPERDIAVGYHSLRYQAAGIGALFSLDPGRFFRSISAGVDTLRDFLISRSSRCPDERIILAGVSQGAMVLHRTMWELGDRPQVHRAIVGALAIADGDRFWDQRSHQYGSRTTRDKHRDNGIGVIGRRLDGGWHRARTKPLPRWVRGWWHSVCDTNDIVCDPIRSLGVGDYFEGHLFVSPATFAYWVNVKAFRIHHGRDVHVNHYKPGNGVKGAVERLIAARANLPDVIRTTTLPDAVVGESYAVDLRTQPGRSGIWSVASGTVPNGLSLTPDGTLVGTPSTAGTATLTIEFTDTNAGTTYRRALPLTIVSADTNPTITTTTLPDAVVGVGYSQRLTIDDVREGSWSITTGALPEGLSLEPASGVISGTPLYPPGQHAFTVKFADNRGQSDTATLALLVGDGATINIGAASAFGYGPLLIGGDGDSVRYPGDSGWCGMVWHRSDGLSQRPPAPPACEGEGMSADGRYLYLRAERDDTLVGASQRICDEEQGIEDGGYLYEWDRIDGDIKWVPLGGHCLGAYDVSGDGTTVAFEDPTLDPQLFVWSRTTRSVIASIPAPSDVPDYWQSVDAPTISNDGTRVAYTGSVPVNTDDGWITAAFIWDRPTGVTRQVAGGDEDSSYQVEGIALSDTGQYLLMQLNTRYACGDCGALMQYAYTSDSAQTLDSGQLQGIGFPYHGSQSADGSIVLYSQLNDPGGWIVWNRDTGERHALSYLAGRTTAAVIGADGRHVAYIDGADDVYLTTIEP